MSRKINVAITGYYSTGSSALVDLLKEYDNTAIASPVDGDYEHMAFYSPGALYDLGAILLGDSRCPYTSDMAINHFIESAKRLYEHDFGWYGSYKKYYGNRFMESTLKFVEEISKKKDRKSAAHAKEVRFSIKKAILQLGAKLVYKRPITVLGREYVFDDNPTYFSVPTIEEFSKASKEYAKSYLEMCGKDADVNVFDHLLWPQQVSTLDVYMPDNLKVIVLQRDPRDMYLLNKYYWHKPPVSTANPYYPTDAQAFIEEWKRTISLEKDTERVLFLNFEDLIYRYEETVKKIEQFLGISEENHIRQFNNFEPERSIENTQVFNLSDDWKNEVSCFEHELKDYLYQFPYERVPDKRLWFDTDLQLKGVKEKKKINR